MCDFSLQITIVVVKLNLRSQ